MVSGSALSAAPVGKTSYFTLSNVAGGVEDIEVNVEGEYPLFGPASAYPALKLVFVLNFLFLHVLFLFSIFPSVLMHVVIVVFDGLIVFLSVLQVRHLID